MRSSRRMCEQPFPQVVDVVGQRRHAEAFDLRRTISRNAATGKTFDDSCHSMGATRSISSWQCRGAGGSCSGDSTVRISKPQIEHRYRSVMRRISPSGGGPGNGVPMARSMPTPNLSVTNAKPVAATIRTNMLNLMGSASQPSRSISVALAIPPPSHIVCNP
jgi:hypothetical protein